MQNIRILVLFIAVVIAPTAIGHPGYFHGRNIAHTCTEHPSKAVGGHLPPVTDTAITVKATRKGQPVTAVCPGENYTLSISFGGDKRAALVTVSGGTLKSSNVAGCANAITTLGNDQVGRVSSRWTVPCSLLGRVEVKVTSSNSSTGPFLKGSAGFNVLPGSQCPGFSKCKASSQDPTPAPPHSSTTAPPAPFDSTNKTSSGPAGNQQDPQGGDESSTPSGPLFFAVNAPGEHGDSSSQGTSRPGRMCSPSNLGYQCSGTLSEGVVLHYSYGGLPPYNVCTNKTNIEKGARNSTSLMHFAIETEQQGYVSLGFPLAPGRMVPADAVLGKLDNATGVVKVSTYRLTGSSAAGIKPMSGWATAMGAVRRYRGTTNTESGSNSRNPGSSVYMLVCFSRPASVKASLVPNLDPSMVPIIWASHSSDSFDARHDKDGSLIINMLSGQHAVLNHHDSTVSKPKYIAHIAHGATMMAAFCLLMPAAGLIARHRWIFTPADEVYDPNTSGGWLALHFFMQLFGTAAAVVSYIMAMLMWFRQHNIGFDRHLLYAPHCELGTGVMAMVAVQVFLGFLRTCLPERHWPAWSTMHSMWGWATVVAGGANCVLGTFLMRDLLGMPWLMWLLPVACSLGALLLTGLFLEIPRLVRLREARAWSSDGSCDMSSKHRGKADASIDISRRTTTDQAEALELTPTNSNESSAPGGQAARYTVLHRARLRTSSTSGGGLTRV